MAKSAISSINQTERMKRLGQKLRQARGDCGLNQEDVGIILNLSDVFGGRGGDYQSNVSRIENGHRQLKVLELEEFARLYQKPLEFFATWAEEDEKRLQNSIVGRASVLGNEAGKAATGKEPHTQRPATLRKRQEKLVACLAALRGDNNRQS
jgi:transcriptional regulator with XRE-family HTH domain